MTSRFRLLIVASALLYHASASAQAGSPMEFDCLLEPAMVVNLGTPVAGVLSDVLIERGDVVAKGAPLARLDSRAQRAAVALSRARAEFAARRITRTDELFNDDLVSNQERDELETERELAELELAERSVQVKIRTLRSPINGVVVDRVRAPGDFVQDTEIATLAQIDPLHVEVTLPVAQFGKIREGTMATVRPQAPVGGSYEASVSVVDKVVDAASGTFRVRLKIPNKSLAIPPGLRCRVAFDVES